jgi:TRAP-type mannitol/chloroaromatic compound transport system substrate-binding protein
MEKTMKLTTLLAATAVAMFATGVSAKDIDMQSYIPGSLPLLGDAGVELGERVSVLTGGSLNIHFKSPGDLVNANEIWDSVSTGAIEAGWYVSGMAEGVIPSASLFTSFPFGPDVKEYSAWWYNGGGKELWAEVSAPYGIHSELCSVLVPEASGWFNKEMKTIDDFNGMKMRIFGLGAAVLQQLGAEAQSMSVGDTMAGLNLGTLDAAEISFPAIDLRIGMNEHAKYYYFPGWHQQTSFILFIMNQNSWDALSDQERASINSVCTANIARTMAQGEVIQLAPLAEMQASGTVIKQWPDEMLATFEAAWEEVVVEKSAADADFKRVWAHIQAFRAEYATWAEIGYLK